jgi:hypothetical protein
MRRSRILEGAVSVYKRRAAPRSQAMGVHPSPSVFSKQNGSREQLSFAQDVVNSFYNIFTELISL